MSYLWNQTEVNKKAKQGEVITATFTYFGKKAFKRITSSCDCVSISTKSNHITAKWQTKKKPSSYTSTKYIRIIFDDDSIEELTINAELEK